MLDKILSFIAEKLTKSQTNLTSSNWTAGTADFVSGRVYKWGDIRVLYLQVRTNTALTADVESDLGTLSGVSDISGMVYGVGTGIGQIVALGSGVVRQRSQSAIGTNSNIYIRFWWIK